MPPRPASRPWGVQNHSGGSRAAAPDADAAVLTIEPGAAIVARLREALRDAPAAQRFVIHQVESSPIVAEGPSNSPSHSGGGQGGGCPVNVVAVPVSDTCKEVINGVVRRTVPRDSLVTISGPWVFSREALTDGVARLEGREHDITGLLAFCEAARLKVRVVLRG